jgi:hypothetical protein
MPISIDKSIKYKSAKLFSKNGKGGVLLKKGTTSIEETMFNRRLGF